MSKQKKEELHLDENELATWAERKVGSLKPYVSQIMLGIALAFAAFVAITYFVNARRSAYANQWRELSVANTDLLLNQNTAALLTLAENYPNQKAAMWSLQIAGDADLQAGLAQLSYDREGGFAIIKRARTNLQQVVDASSAIKSKGLQQRALFSLAYACESLGEFEDAKKYYQQLIDENPDAAFAEPARRGVARAENPELIALYENFKSWKDLADDAPGPIVPTTPNIDFPDVDVDQPEGGNDFEGGESASTGNDKSQDVTTTAAPADDQLDATADNDTSQDEAATESGGGESETEANADKSDDGEDEKQDGDQ